MRCVECGKYPFCEKIDNPQKTDCANMIKKPLKIEKQKENEMKEICVCGVKIRYDKKCVSIIDSYKIHDKDTMWVTLECFLRETNYESNRSIESWIKEWRSHNRLYNMGLFKEHTKDCELEENEKLHRLICYQILGF